MNMYSQIPENLQVHCKKGIFEVTDSIYLNDTYFSQASSFEKKTAENRYGHYCHTSENVSSPSADYIDIINKDALKNESVIDIKSREIHPYDLPLPALDMSNNLIFIPTVTENELAFRAVSLSTRNTLILSKFESAVLSSRRMAAEVVRSDKGITYLLIWIPRNHTYFYTDLTENASNQIVLQLFSRKEIIKITYSPYWLYSLLYRYNNGRIKNVFSIQSMHYLSGLDGTDYINILSSHGAVPAISGKDYKSTQFINSLVFRMMPSYSLCYRKLLRFFDVKTHLDKLHMYMKLIEAVSISYDMSFWYGTNAFLFTMPKPFSYKFNSIDINQIPAPGYVITYTARYLIEPPYPFFEQVLYMLSEKGRLRHLKIHIFSYSDNQLVLYIMESSLSYALEMISRTIFDCVAGKAEYGISIDYKYIHIVHQNIATYDDIHMECPIHTTTSILPDTKKSCQKESFPTC